MFDSLFGTEPSVAKFVIAFVAVIALIALTAWLVRRFGASRLGGSTARGRQPRLAVIDAAPVDGRRRLVLIRRDNIEHLLMIGGPSDVVVEANIVRASTRDTGRGPSAEPVARTLPVETGMAWPLQPEPAPVIPSPPPTPVTTRNVRANFDDHGWNAGDLSSPREPVLPREPAPLREPASSREPAPPREPALSREPSVRPRPDSLTGMAADLAADLSAKLSAPDLMSFGRTPHAAEPVARSAPPVEPVRREAEPEQRAGKSDLKPEPKPEFKPELKADHKTDHKADHNLAEMASRLEAALRRPPQLEGRPPVTDPLAMAPDHAAPEPKAPEVKLTDVKPSEVKAPEVKAPVAKAPEAAAPKSVPPKSIYDNLEQEMASLLGRPATKQ